MNSDIHNLTPVSSVLASAEFEVQLPDETITKKCTLTQLTQIEETARALADDTIESASGLNTDGTYPTLSDSYYLRAVDFTAGFPDRAGAHAAVPQNIMNAIRAIDSKLYANSVQLSSTIRSIVVTCSAADILSCNAVHKVVISCPDDRFIEIISVSGVNYFNSTPFEAGSNKLEIRYADSGGKICELSNTFLESNTSCIYRGIMNTALEVISNMEDVVLTCASAPTGGNGTIYLFILYRELNTIY